MTVAVRNVAAPADGSSDAFKGAMRALAGGVSVITSGKGSEITGMTVTSVTSLSVEPASLIVSVNRSSSTFPLLKKYNAFGVNVLAAAQRDIAERFSGKGGLKGADRFLGSKWEVRETGVPLLVGALASIDCQVEELIERHSHVLVIGRVLSSRTTALGAGLGYYQGEYVDIVRGFREAGQVAGLKEPALDLREF